jgi:hypothetical protein
MQTAITTQPALPPELPEIHPQLIFTLEWWDHLAWWMCRWDRSRSHSHGGLGRGARLLIWLVGVPFGALAAGGLMAATPAGRLDPNARLVACVGAAVVIWFLGYAVTRRGFPGDLIEQALRDDYEGRMRDKARDLQLVGDEINRDRIHWFISTAEGFLEVTTVNGVSFRGMQYYEHREAGGPWRLVEHVVVTPNHLFLVRPGDEAYIIPTRCFADAQAVTRFVEIVQGCRAAARAPVGAIALESAEAIQAQPPSPPANPPVRTGDEPCTPESSPQPS